MTEHAVRHNIHYGLEQLRPGIMLAGLIKNRSDRNHWIGTTSEVCVRSPTSSKSFVTAAAHSFPAGVGDLVFHPWISFTKDGPNKQYQIGIIKEIFGETDIALVEFTSEQFK